MRSISFVLVLSICHESLCASMTHGSIPAFADTPRNKALADVAVEQQTNHQAGMTNLRFQACTNYTTQPAKYDKACLIDFFFREENRDMLLAGSSGNRVEYLQAPDLALYHLWGVEAGKNHARPSVGDPILRVTTTAIQFPGLTLQTVATVGCKKVMKDPNHLELQVTLICDELQAEGPKPLVWVFHQLTGVNKGEGPLFPTFLSNPKTDSSERRTHSTNTISAEKTTDNGVIFRSVARLVIDVNFPSLLLHVLPVSKQMAEKQGSSAILKVVERDIGPSLEALCKRYMELVESK